MFSIRDKESNKKKLYYQNKKLYRLIGIPEAPGYKNLHKVKISEEKME